LLTKLAAEGVQIAAILIPGHNVAVATRLSRQRLAVGVTAASEVNKAILRRLILRAASRGVQTNDRHLLAENSKFTLAAFRLTGGLIIRTQGADCLCFQLPLFKSAGRTLCDDSDCCQHHQP